MQVIIFQNDNGGVSVVYPAQEFSAQVEAVAWKDVPIGKSWRIINAADLPPRTTRNRWQWTASGPLTVAEP